jgi:hypothetical protein
MRKMSAAVASIVQGERFLTIFRITEWGQFTETMKANGLQLAEGVNLEALGRAAGF